MSETELARQAVICDSCGTAYAGLIRENGDVLPIGRRGGNCRCGSTDFHIVEL